MIDSQLYFLLYAEIKSDKRLGQKFSSSSVSNSSNNFFNPLDLTI